MISGPPITPDEMRAIEERAERMGVSRLLLMESAGKAVADYVETKMGAAGRKVVVVAGTGNNGGDGFVAARHLAAYGALVRVFLVGSGENIRTPEASLNWRIMNGVDRSVELFQLSDGSFMDRLGKAISEADVVVDAIFGTGLKGELKEPYASVIESINKSRAFKLAVDVPSGLDPLSGEVCGLAVRADATVTFHRAKKGLSARRDLVGELVVANIGIPPEADLVEPRS
jgi:NAD(P)H-hydrate epimerase